MPAPFVLDVTAEPQTLNEIRSWHQDVVDALREQRTSVQGAIRAGSLVSTKFVVMTEAEVDAHYDGQRRELDRLAMLNLVAMQRRRLRSISSGE